MNCWAEDFCPGDYRRTLDTIPRHVADKLIRDRLTLLGLAAARDDRDALVRASDAYRRCLEARRAYLFGVTGESRELSEFKFKTECIAVERELKELANAT